MMAKPKVIKIAFEIKMQLQLLRMAKISVIGDLADPRIAHW